MSDPLAISLTAAAIAGLAGSAHCFAMCGGIAGALGFRAGAATDSTTRLGNALLYQAGRLTGYAVAGALCGLMGSGLLMLINVSGLLSMLRIAGGVLIVFVALRIALRWNLLGWLERLGSRVWMRLRPLASRCASQRNPASTLTLGFLWGWLPCGLVYSMLLFAAMSRSPAMGAAIMAAYGIGTLPSMLGTTLFSAQLQRIVARPTMRFVSAATLALFGAWMIVAAVVPAAAIDGLYCFSPR